MIFCLLSWQVEAVSTSVQDSSVLVQRSTLDLILFCFPFHMSQVRAALCSRGSVQGNHVYAS